MGLQGLLHYGRERSSVCIVMLKIFPVMWDGDSSHVVSLTCSGNVLSWGCQNAG